MSKVLVAFLGAIIGFCVGSLIGPLLGMLWITIFPPDRVAGGPEAGFGTVMGAGIAGEVIGIIAGIYLSLRYRVTRRSSSE